MAGTGYSVASASQLLGAKPPRSGPPPEQRYFANMQKTDNQNREKSAIKRQDHIKTVRFTPSTSDASTEYSAQESISSSERTTSDNSPKLPKTPKLQTSFDGLSETSSSLLSRSGSTSSRRGKKDLALKEIYFSPIASTKSQVFLSSPQPSPPLTPISTPPPLETPPDASAGGLGRYKAPKKEKLTLTTRDVDRLVTALAAAPLVQMNVRKQHWADLPTDMLTAPLRDMPSVTSLESEQTSEASTAPSLYSLPNQPFLTEQRTASMTQRILEEEFARDFPDHPKAKKPEHVKVMKQEQTQTGSLSGIAITDPSVAGCPVRSMSSGYSHSTNVLKVGKCSYLNVPYGASTDCNIRVEPPSPTSEHSRIYLQAVDKVLDRKTGRAVHLLVAEQDMTRAFTKAALHEFAKSADVTLDEIDIALPTDESRESTDSIDWCALADELAASCSITDKLEAAATACTGLKSETCTMQTLTLLSELEGTKKQYQDFVVLQTTIHDDLGRPRGVKVPLLSQALYSKLYDDGNSTSSASNSARALRETLVAAVAPGLASSDVFETGSWWGVGQRKVKCVPLTDGTSGKDTSWACFIRSEYDVPY